MQDMSNLHICVVTPTYNRVAYLPEAIDSVFANVKAPLNFTFEHLICENACTDGTKEYLEEASKQAGVNIRFWSEPEKLLPGPARNRVLKYAAEESWIMPLDDDDVMLQRNLFHFADNIKNNPEKQWFMCDFLRMDQDRRYMLKEDYYAWKFPTAKDMLKAIFAGETFIQGNVCYSTKLFNEVGGYNEKLRMAEDLDLYIRFLIAGHLPGVSTHVSHLHRFHTGNISIGVDLVKHRVHLQEIYDMYIEPLEKLGIPRP